MDYFSLYVDEEETVEEKQITLRKLRLDQDRLQKEIDMLEAELNG